MDENTLENALKQIQAWFVNGEFDKVKQGCQEVLQISPDNSIAQDLLQKAEEALGGATAAPAPAPAEPTPMGSTEPTPPAEPAAEPAEPGPLPNQIDPLLENVEAEAAPATPTGTPDIPPMAEAPAEPEPEPIPEPPMPETMPEKEPPMPETVPETPSEEAIPMPAAEVVPEEEHHKTHSLIVNILILVILIVVGIIGVYAYQALRPNNSDQATTTPVVENTVTDEDVTTDNDGKGEEVATEEEVVTDEETDVEENSTEVVNPDAETRNNARLADLTSVENALIYYYDAHKQYPTVDEINTILIDQGFLESMPVAPLEGEAYIYAVYDTDLGPAQAYVLSAEFENEDGSSSPWSTGANTTTEHPDFNDVSLENVTILSETMTKEEWLANHEYEEITEEIVVEEETTEQTDERTRVPRVVLD